MVGPFEFLPPNSWNFEPHTHTKRNPHRMNLSLLNLCTDRFMTGTPPVLMMAALSPRAIWHTWTAWVGWRYRREESGKEIRLVMKARVASWRSAFFCYCRRCGVWEQKEYVLNLHQFPSLSSHPPHHPTSSSSLGIIVLLVMVVVVVVIILSYNPYSYPYS